MIEDARGDARFYSLGDTHTFGFFSGSAGVNREIQIQADISREVTPRSAFSVGGWAGKEEEILDGNFCAIQVLVLSWTGLPPQ